MSPEQLRGEEFDARSDLFSFGLVLYEMVTGRSAFAGATSAIVSAAILHDSRPLPRAVRPELPERLEDTILKALEKDRAPRCRWRRSYARFRAICAHVQRWWTPTHPRRSGPAALRRTPAAHVRSSCRGIVRCADRGGAGDAPSPQRSLTPFCSWAPPSASWRWYRSRVGCRWVGGSPCRWFSLQDAESFV